MCRLLLEFGDPSHGFLFFSDQGVEDGVAAAVLEHGLCLGGC